MVEARTPVEPAELAGVPRVGTLVDGTIRTSPLVSVDIVRRTALRLAFLTSRAVQYEADGPLGIATLDQARVELSRTNLNEHLDRLTDQREQVVNTLAETTREMITARFDDFPPAREAYRALERVRDQALLDLMRVQDETRVELDFARAIYGHGFRSPQVSH